MAEKHSISKRRLWLFRGLLLVVAPLVFLLVLELFLRLIGVGYDTSFLIPDERDGSKLRDNPEFSYRFFPKALARTPQPMRDRSRKANGHQAAHLLWWLGSHGRSQTCLWNESSVREVVGEPTSRRGV